MTRFFTIGHSNRDLDVFIELLTEHSVAQVVDVRRLPGSKRYPQFNEDTLGEALEQHGVRFFRLQALTGRRPVSKEVPFEVNAWWENRSFHNYADHALSEEFREGFADLQDAGKDQPTAVMCSEAVWWRCHRRLISDYLLAAGHEVLHILGASQAKPAQLSPGATPRGDGTVVYPPEEAP